MAISDLIPEGISFGGGSAVSMITIVVIIFVVAIFAGVGIYFLSVYLRFKYRVIFFEDIAGNGTFEPVGKDRAMLMKIGDGGERVLYTLKRKLYLPAAGTPISKRTYWYKLGPDMYWRNFLLKGDTAVDNITDRDMRYANVAIRRNIEQRYDKTSFWEKYGGLVAYTVLILVTAIGMWLLFDKWLEVSGALTSAVESAKEVLDAAKEVLGAVDNVQTGGSGIAKG